MVCDLSRKRVAFADVNAAMLVNSGDENVREDGPNRGIRGGICWCCYDPSISPDERWFYAGPTHKEMRVVIWDNTVWPPQHVGIMGEGLYSGHTYNDDVIGEPVGIGVKGGAWISADGQTVWTSDSWYVDTRTWKPLGMMRNEKGQVIRSSKMNEVHLRGKDCVYVGQRFGFGRYKVPVKIFPCSTDKTPPTGINDLKATVGKPSFRWIGGEITVEVRLTWSAATDNEGVQRYAVWRNGVLLGNTLGVNPGIDPVLSSVDQAEYEKQAGKCEPNTFKARYVVPGKTYKFEIEPIDFAQNRGPRTTISVEVPSVSDEKQLEMVKPRIEQILSRATANNNEVRETCVAWILEMLTTHKFAKGDALFVLDRLTPLAERDGRDGRYARSIKARIETKRKELEGGK